MFLIIYLNYLNIEENWDICSKFNILKAIYANRCIEGDKLFWSVSSLIALMSGVFQLTCIYLFLFLHYGEKYLLKWTLSWFVYSLGYVFAIIYAVEMKTYYLIILNQVSLLLSGFYLLWGTYEFVEKKISKRWLAALVFGVLWICYAVCKDYHIRMITFPTYTFMGLIYIWTGFVIAKSYKFKGLGKRVTATCFILWGLYKLFLPVFGKETWLTPWGYLISWLDPWGFLISIIMTFTVAICILLVFFGKLWMDLKNSEERFRLLAENARDIIYRISLFPYPEIEYISTASYSIIGYSPQELREKNTSIINLVHSEDRVLAKGLLCNPQKKTVILRWIHRNRSLVWVEHSNVPIHDSKGNCIAIEGIARDITSRKKAELEVLKAQERVARAEQMATLGTMAAGIAHEINQPLNSLKVTADGMLYLYKEHDLIDTDEILDSVKYISKQATRIEKIIKHMRSIIKSNKADKNAICNINKAVESGLSIISAQLSAHNITLKRDLQPNLPELSVQSIHIEEIIINLVVNAMNALKEIKKDYKVITCKTFQQQEIIYLEVSDNGPGMEEKIKQKIFDPFFTTNNSLDNMGLGLLIVKSIVESYKGEIYIDSTSEGVSFKIAFSF